jgi:hypothetical protein
MTHGLTGIDLLLQVLDEFAQIDRQRRAAGLPPGATRFQQAFPACQDESCQLPDWTQTFRQGPVGALRETWLD